jgi:hypothetical protein
MTVYLLHFDQPLPRGVSRFGTQLQAGHYIGWTDDLVGRILDHSETTWSPLSKPVVMEDGRVITGVTHGKGATLMGVVNSRNIPWRLARTWDGADQNFESRIKHRKATPRLCPICNPQAHRLAKEQA